MERNKNIQIRVTEEEKNEIEKSMKRENFSNISEYIRKIMLDRARQNSQ